LNVPSPVGLKLGRGIHFVGYSVLNSRKVIPIIE
jgi:hypothetical protein